MTGDQKALSYFSVDSQTCFVRVSRLLTEDNTRDIRYTVGITFLRLEKFCFYSWIMYVSVNRRHVWKSWMEKLSELLLLTGDSNSNWQCQSQPSVFHSNSLCECAPWPFPASVHQPSDRDPSPGVIQHQQYCVYSHGHWPGPEGNHRVWNDRHVPSSELLWRQSHLWKSVPEERPTIWQSPDFILCSEY